MRKRSKAINSKSLFFIIFSILFLLLSACSSKKNIIATCNGFSIDSEEYRYRYISVVDQFRSANAKIESLSIDYDFPLSKQSCPLSDYATWQDYFVALTNAQVERELVLMSKESVSEKDLPKDAVLKIDSVLLSNQMSASAAGVTLQSWYESRYFKGFSEDKLRFCLIRSALTDQVSEHLANSENPSEDDLEACYQKNADQFDVYSLSVANFPTIEDAEKYLNSGCSDRTQLVRYDYLHYDELQSIGALDFASDPVRSSGDISVVVNSVGTYNVLLFHLRSKPIECYSNFCHILFSGNDAKNLAAQAYEKLVSSSKTVDDFCNVVTEFDPQCSEYVYNDIRRGDLFPELEDWVFGVSNECLRSSGDCVCIEDDSGVHLMMFLLYGEPVWKVEALKFYRDFCEEALIADANIIWNKDVIDNIIL